MRNKLQTCKKCGEVKRIDYFHKYWTKTGNVPRKICKQCSGDNAVLAAVAKRSRKIQALMNWPDLCHRDETYE